MKKVGTVAAQAGIFLGRNLPSDWICGLPTTGEMTGCRVQREKSAVGEKLPVMASLGFLLRAHRCCSHVPGLLRTWFGFLRPR